MGPARDSRIDDPLGCESFLVLFQRDRQRFVEVRREPLDGDVDAWVRIEGSIVVPEIDRDGVSRKWLRLGSLRSLLSKESHRGGTLTPRSQRGHRRLRIAPDGASRRPSAPPQRPVHQDTCGPHGRRRTGLAGVRVPLRAPLHLGASWLVRDLPGRATTPVDRHRTLTFFTTGSPSRLHLPIRPLERVFGTCQSWGWLWRGRFRQSRTRRLLVAGGTHPHELL